MALPKQSVPINFSQGLDTKTDPKQVQLGKFLALTNTVFEKGGLLQKRNGNLQLPSLPDATNTLVTTFNNNLTAIGTSLEALNSGGGTWINKGRLEPLQLDTLPLVRSNTNQSYADCATAPNGLICTVFTDNVPNSATTTAPIYKYVIADSVTGQNIVPITLITPSVGTATGSPRVFSLGRYFVIILSTLNSGVSSLQYIAISITDPASPSAPVSIAAYTPSSRVSWDATVANNSLYLAYNTTSGGQSVKVTYLDSTLVQHTTATFSGQIATDMSISADISGSTPVIYAAYYDSASTNGHILAVTQTLVTVLAPTATITGEVVANITVVAQNMLATIVYEITNAYGYDSGIPTNYIEKINVTQGGSVTGHAILVRSVGLASTAFLQNGKIYFLTVYFSQFQPSYFLMNITGQIVAKLAYSNGGTYYATGLPQVQMVDGEAYIPYLYKDLVQAINKNVQVNNSAGIYAQTGVNLAKFNFTTQNISSAEIGNNLNISGGIVWAYDGYAPVEQGFNVWPDNVEATWSSTGGAIHAQPDGATNTNAYYYQATYEWSDNQGNLFRSAPSIPVAVTTTGSGTTGSIAINVPTLRLTYKLANPVKLVIYRWSVFQETFFQVTSIQIPVLNDPTVDYITYTDTLSDGQIAGNNIIYTTGGVVEDIGPPSATALALFKSRCFLIDSEDKNLLWYSKQVIEATPVEFSDLFTIYVAPTLGAEASSGPNRCLQPMDDKLVIFKDNSIYYITGTGPDNTGANNDFSEPVFVNSTIGCDNQASIVFIPGGLMFQSPQKGIWLLGRDLTTTYIGAPVEQYNASRVLSALNVPGTNQVRFALDNGVVLMYDYYYSQWGTFSGVPAISSCVYKGLHTFINTFGQVFQENPGSYLDGSSPVLMSFTTAWANLTGLQGFERFYYFYLLGTYKSPHKLNISIGYDYNNSPSQGTVISPDNYGGTYGSQSPYGAGVYGGSTDLEQWRIFVQKQKCQAFQITVAETFDSTYGTIAGEGLNISGLNLVVGAKKSYPTLRPSRSVG